jgi:hypothetical protein
MNFSISQSLSWSNSPNNFTTISKPSSNRRYN